MKVKKETAALLYEKTKAFEQGYRPSQSLACKHLREVHDIHIVIDRYCIGSDEFCYGYKIEYLPAGFKDEKRRVIHYESIESFKEGYGSYTGGWDRWEEACEEAILRSISLIDIPGKI